LTARHRQDIFFAKRNVTDQAAHVALYGVDIPQSRNNLRHRLNRLGKRLTSIRVAPCVGTLIKVDIHFSNGRFEN